MMVCRQDYLITGDGERQAAAAIRMFGIYPEFANNLCGRKAVFLHRLVLYHLRIRRQKENIKYL